MSKDEAVKIIIKFETCPIYLHNKVYEYNRAINLIENMHGPLKRDANAEIRSAIDKYYLPICEMEQYTPYDMDVMMMNGSV